MDITLKGLPSHMQKEALTAVNTFCSAYPDRIGIRKGVAYQRLSKALYVYRTNAGNIVVRFASIEPQDTTTP